MKIKSFALVIAGFLSITNVFGQQSGNNEAGKAIIKGQVTNPIDTIQGLTLFAFGEGLTLKVPVHKDGSFLDTLTIPHANGYRVIYGYGNYITDLYLDAKTNLTINFDAKEARKTMSFSGESAEANNLLRQSKDLIHNLDGAIPKSLFSLPANEFEQKVDMASKGFLEKVPDVIRTNSPELFKLLQKNLKDDKMILMGDYDHNHILTTVVGKGGLSPLFKDYAKYGGGKASLADFRGKYVYLDLWATWCKPCLQEMPFLQKLEEEYMGRNIYIIGISLDQPAARQKWETFVKTHQLGGIQLYAGKAFDSPFIKAYDIIGIPRYILLDPTGHIISNDAPRPSDPKLKELLASLPEL